MAQKLETDIVINLAGNMSQKARQYGASMTKFAQKNQRAMRIVRMSTQKAGKAIDMIGNRFTGMVAGGGLMMMAKEAGNTSAALTRMGTNSLLTGDQVSELEGRIRETAEKYRVGSGEIIKATDLMLGRSGNYQATLDNIDNMGLALQGLGADAESVGLGFGDMVNNGTTQSRDLKFAMEQMTGQFANGSVSLKEQFKELPALLALTSHKGKEAALELTAMHQIFAEGFATPSEATTSMESFFRAFTDRKKISFLEKEGVQIYAKGTEDLLTPAELLVNTLEAARYSALNLADVFESEAVNGLKKFGEKLEGSKFESNIEKFKWMIGKDARIEGVVDDNAIKNAAEFNNQLNYLSAQFERIAHRQLSSPIRDLADALSVLDDETIDRWVEMGKVFAGIAVAAVALKKGMSFISDVKSVFGKNGIPGKGGKGGFSDLGAMPVYVVNMSAGGMGGVTDSIVPGGKSRESKASKALRYAKGAGRFAAGAAIMIGSASIVVGGVYSAAQLAHDMSPVDFRRSSTVDTTGLPENFPIDPGLLDVFDDIKSLFSGSSNAVESKSSLEIKVSDDRVRVSNVNAAPGLNVDIDTGRSTLNY